MKPVTLAVTLNVADKVGLSVLPRAVQRVLQWVLMNDVEGAEILTLGQVGDDIAVAIAKSPLNTMPSAEALLADLTDKQLVEEIVRRRATLIPSIWNVEDFRPLVKNDEDCAELADEQIDQVAQALLAKCSHRLPEVLAERGNNWTAERWLDHKDELLSQVRSNEPSVSL